MQKWLVPGRLPLREALEQWKDAVTLYSSGTLTYGSDRLPAIAGLAKYVYSLVPGSTIKYLAGHWGLDLVSSLLWYKVGPGLSSSRLEQYRAPSWSWTAVSGAISFYHIQGHGVKQTAFIKRQNLIPLAIPLAL